VSVDLTHFFEKNSDGYTCAAVFLDMSTWLLWHFPMRDKTCGEFVQALAAYRRHVRETFSVDLRVVRTDNDPCFTDVHSRTHGNVRELQAYLDSLPANESIQFVHSPPEYQALNPVECAVRQLYYLMNFFLEQGSLTSLCWLDMLDAGIYVMNRLPHPQSRVTKRQTRSAHELAYGRKPDLSDLIAAPGELVVIDWIGTKASAGARRARVLRASGGRRPLSTHLQKS
jgi:hypothetical protein